MDSPSPAIAAAVAQRFELGEPLGPLRAVDGGRSHRMWRLATESGVWAVKELNRSREPWWIEDYLIAARIEQCAWDSALPMPRPRSPREPAAPLLADIDLDGTPTSFRVHEWLDGRHPTHADPVDPRWVGETLARLHRLPVALDPAGANRYEPYGAQDWRIWLEQSPDDVPSAFLDEVGTRLPEVARAKEIIDDAAAGDARASATPVFTHRDVKPDNVLLTARGPVLLDWDGAGLDLAESETLRAALAFSREPAGWDRARFSAVVRSYHAAGGARIPAEQAVFEGVLRSQLGAAAFLLWRALGHRPAAPAERQAAYQHTLELLDALHDSLCALETWTSWLRAATED